MNRYLRRFYEVVNDPSLDSFKLVWKFAKQFVLIVKIFSMFLVFMGLLVAPTPFVVYAIFGHWEPLALVYMPFVDENTFIGFWTLYVYHLMTAALTVLGFICADLVLGILIVHYIPMVLVFQQHVVQFNEIITKNTKFGETKEAFAFFANIIMLHKDLVRYML